MCDVQTAGTNWPPVELFHLLRGSGAGDAVAALAAVVRPLPGCGPVYVVHVENSAVAVDTSFPVWGNREIRSIKPCC